MAHRDLKPTNILLSHNGSIKLADLGLAAFWFQPSTNPGGTFLYAAPEVFIVKY